ncbi:MAG: hypothetical protein ACRCYY_09785 [Trueperaceae bacterium]
MKRIGLIVSFLGLLLLSLATAQQEVSLGGIARTKDAEGKETTPENTKVAIHLVDADNAWQREIASAVPTAGTFNIQTAPVNAEELVPFRNGAVLLPGLQNEYEVSPEGVNYAKGQLNMYVDEDGNNVFDRASDGFFIGVASLDKPIGFFALVYVDQNVTITGKGQNLEFSPGWNIYTVRYPEEGDPIYAVETAINDVLVDVFLP